jgi:type IV pilus assembly protein PilQ
MKTNVRCACIAVLAGFMMFVGNVQYARSASPGVADSGGSIGYLENITFEKVKSKERVILTVSRPSATSIDSAAGNTVLVKMENIFVPEELRRSLGEDKLSNISRVLPVQKTVNGAQWAMIAIDLREMVPYSVGQQGPNIFIDFNVASLEGKKSDIAQTPSQTPPPVMETPAKNGNNGQKPAESQAAREGTQKQYSGKVISLDFQDASIKAVLRLLAEAGAVTIVSGDDVKGSVTVHMNKVPWDQALDTILDINGLAKKRMGDVISIMTLEKLKKDEADRKQGEEDRIKAELTAKKAEQERLEERGKLQQVSIEAKIVEATDDFIRNLGIQWGGVTYQSVSGTPYAITAGTNTTSSNATSYGYPTGIPTTFTTAGTRLSAAAVNLPATIASPSIGLVIGGASGVLEAQLSALETTSQGKIISSPKVTTMDNVKATIKQGQEIPFITIDKDGNRSITFKEAVLKLEVKPKITPDGKISMEIKATNDSADYARGEQLGGNPPINKSEIESRIVVQDGDTIAIGGILRTEDTKGTSGVPWLSKIPVLGWLFKSESNTKNRKQLMVFVTPKIMKDDTTGGKLEKTTE